MNFERALDALRAGEFVLIHDSNGRENEVDMVIQAEAVGPRQVVTMREDAGGLICVALKAEVADSFGIPYLTDIYRAAQSKFKVLEAAWPNDIPYDERSAFSITVNHRRTFTGVTDVDRALTISELGKLGAKSNGQSLVEEFGRNFRSPGHVHLLRAAKSLLSERRGHTELVVALAGIAGVTPVVTVCEMLDDRTGRALQGADVKEYASKHGLELLEGTNIVKMKEEG